MRSIALVLLLAVFFFSTSCASSPPGTETLYSNYQALTIVNQSKYPLIVFKEGREVAHALLPGKVQSFTFASWLENDADIAFAAVAPDRAGAAVRHFPVYATPLRRDVRRSEVWIIRDSDLAHGWGW